MRHRLVLGILCGALLTANARAELSREQLSELRARLDQLAACPSNETHQSAAALQRWARQQDAALPVDVLCERAGDTQSLRQLSANLAALEATPGTNDFAAARATLAQVLADAEFRNAVQPNWWEQIMARLGRWIDRLMRMLGRVPGADKIASAMFYVAIVLLLLPLVGVIGYLIWWQTKQRRDAPHIEASQSVTSLESPDVHRARAEEFFRQGQYVEALKQFHLAALSALEQRGLVAPDRTRTNWEYLAQLESQPAAASLLRSLNGIYDRIVFGAQPCDENLTRDFGVQSRQLVETVAT